MRARVFAGTITLKKDAICAFADKMKYDIAAYYWPAYHDEPRWRRFMPDGHGEWETIRKAKPKIPGHEQPRIPAKATTGLLSAHSLGDIVDISGGLYRIPSECKE